MSRKQKDSTLAALLKEKRGRGRPPRPVSRQNVYVALTAEQKKHITELSQCVSESVVRADVPDLAIVVLSTRLEGLRRAVAGRTREIPEGITDLESLYLLWDLPLPPPEAEASWTSIRVSPQQAIDLGRAHGTLNVLFGATRSEVFALALALLDYFIRNDIPEEDYDSLNDLQKTITDVYL